MTSLHYRYPIILASQSSARHHLLTQAEIEHQVIPAKLDEEYYKPKIEHLSIIEQAHYLANLKGEEVSEQHPNHLVIAADQIGSLNRERLFKPMTKDNNIRMLQKLSGQDHQQHTASVIYLNGEPCYQLCDSVTLSMRPLSLETITTYVTTEQPWNCCGGYRFEGLGKHLFNQIDGDADSVLGLTLVPLLAFLHQQNYLKLEKERDQTAG